MAGARNWDVRLPGDPPAEVPEPWFIRQAREGRERESSRTVPDWPEELVVRTPEDRVFDEPGPPPTPDAARKAALHAVMIDTARRRAMMFRLGAAALTVAVIALAVGWTLRGFIEPTVPAFVEQAPAVFTPSEPLAVPPTIAPVEPAAEPAAVTEAPPEIAPVLAEPRVVTREEEIVAPAPIPAKIVAAPPKPSPTRTQPIIARPPVMRSDPTPSESERDDSKVAGLPRSGDPACAPTAPRGLRFVCGDAILGAMNRDYIAVSARLAALDDPAEVRRLARDNERFVERRDRCEDAGCVADRYGDRLEAAEARLRRIERRQAEAAEGKPSRLLECKGFQYFRPTTPCASRRAARQ